MRYIRSNWGLWTGGLLVLGGLVSSLVGIGRSHPPDRRHISVPSVDNPQHLATQGDNVKRLLVGPSGSYFVQRQNSAVDRFDPSGRLLWRLPLGSVEEVAPIEVTDISLNANEELLVVGLTRELPPRTAVYRVSGREADPRIERVALFSELEPAAIAASRDGGGWIAALPTSDINEALARASRGEEFALDLNETQVHRFNRNGEIVGSFLPLQVELHSYEELRRLQQDFGDVRLVLDPDDNLYLYRRERAKLYRFERETGTFSESLPLPHAGFERTVVSDVSFLSRDVVLYSLFQVREFVVTGYQIRLLDLVTGDSTLVEGGRTGEGRRLVLATLDRASGTARLFEPLAFEGLRTLALPEQGRNGHPSRRPL